MIWINVEVELQCLFPPHDRPIMSMYDVIQVLFTSMALEMALNLESIQMMSQNLFNRALWTVCVWNHHNLNQKAEWMLCSTRVAVFFEILISFCKNVLLRGPKSIGYYWRKTIYFWGQFTGRRKWNFSTRELWRGESFPARFRCRNWKSVFIQGKINSSKNHV